MATQIAAQQPQQWAPGYKESIRILKDAEKNYAVVVYWGCLSSKDDFIRAALEAYPMMYGCEYWEG